MFAKLAIVSSLALLAVATPVPTGSSQCNTGPNQCCNSVQSADSDAVSFLAGLLGIVLGPITGQVGINCSPISVIGAGSGANCVQQPVCCTGNSFNGVIVVGCSPININL